MSKELTVPNFISLFRIILIPLYVYYFLFNSAPSHYIVSGIIFVISGFSDVVDGFIARKFNMITNLGKILDPVADKLTHITVAFCLCLKHSYLIGLIIILFIKEALMLTGALVLRKRKISETPSAKWWGKLCTVVVFITFVLEIISLVFVDLIPVGINYTLVGMSIIFLMFSFFNYLKVYFDYISKNPDSQRRKV
ncbi:MAG: CDP-alcohol phosphatidyltransferase family protein [bacterium]|nr:CDP-alcohol phosphatidyltransferase family protein [bacterium]